MYRVLWIDDQHKDEEMIQFSIEADNEGLLLEGYPSFEEGFDVLEKSIERYDAILLDGLFFEKKGQEVGTEDESGIGAAIARINELKNKKVFPWFVLSGKEQFTKGKNAFLKANKANCFDKTNPSDVVELFKQMKVAASSLEDTKLKHKYRQLLDVCNEKYLGEKQFTRIFSLIKHIENDEPLKNTEDMLNPLRKIIEAVFIRFGKIGIIPDAILQNYGWINGSKRFLSNKHVDYTHNVELIPPIIGENIHRLLNLTQDASHGEGELTLKVDDYLKSGSCDYLYRSCIYLLFDLLLWFKSYIDNHDDIEKNKSLWVSKGTNGDWITGRITKIRAETGWGEFKPDNSPKTIGIPPRMVSDKRLTENERIKVITELSPDGSKPHIKEISREL